MRYNLPPSRSSVCEVVKGKLDFVSGGPYDEGYQGDDLNCGDEDGELPSPLLPVG